MKLKSEEFMGYKIHFYHVLHGRDMAVLATIDNKYKGAMGKNKMEAFEKVKEIIRRM